MHLATRLMPAIAHHCRYHFGLPSTQCVSASAGAAEASALQGGVNATQSADPRQDTADFNDRSAGNLRVDYLLPRKSLQVCGSGVFWPSKSDPLSKLVDGVPPPSSDHRLVWLDFTASAARCPPDSDPTASEPWRRHR